MKQFNPARAFAHMFPGNAKILCFSLLLIFSIQATAQNFIVNNNGDTHATSPASSPLDGSGNITLRSAMEAATAQAGPHIISFAGGITNISLVFGQMNIGSATSSNITVNGPGMNILTVTQTTAARVFSTTTQPNFNFTLQDITLTLSPSVITNYSGGGGAIVAGGVNSATTLVNVKITNFRNQIGNGGAVSDSDDDAVHSLTVTNCIFDNNRCGGGGGAVSYNGLGAVNITGCTFSNNSTDVVGANTGGPGGALSISGIAPGPLNANVLRNTFLNNSVINSTSQGGAVMHTNGTMNLNYNRFVGNNTTGDLGDVLYQAGGDAANTVNATNNWWGHNTAPTATEVATGIAPVTAPNVTNWLQLKFSASPTTLCATTSPTTSLIAGSFLSNSAGTAITAGNLSTLIGLPITYSATLGTLSGAQTTIQATGTATVTFTTNGTAGTATVNGVVDNVPANDPTARASITVNILPNISSQPANQTTCAGSTTTFAVTAGGTPTPGYQWRKGVVNLSNGATGNGSTISGAATNTLTITNTALADAAADYNVVITNGCGVVTSNNVSLTVKALPVITAPTVTQPTCAAPTGVIVVNATGASGTIEYSINNGVSYQASATFNGLAPGSSNNIMVRYTAAPNCPVAYASNPVIINALPIAPTVNNPATTTGTVGTAFSQTFTTTGGLAPITFATTSTLPTGLTLSSAGVLSGTPTQSGTFPIVVTATDANGCVGTSAAYNLVISCQTITVTNPGVATGTNGTAFSQAFTQTGGIGAITFSTVSTLPTGLALSAAGVLSGTPSQSGTFPIVVRATDGNSCFANGPTYTLVISCQTITVINPVNATGQLNVAFSETFTQTGGIGAITFTTVSTLPTGLTLSAAGLLSGTATQSGTFPVVVRATDANGCFGNGATYTLIINTCPVITVTNPTNASGTATAAFSETFTSSGGVPAVTYSTASTLPIGLTLSSAGILSGTPLQAGTFPIVVVATDGNGCTGNSPTYTLVIGCPAMVTGTATPSSQASCSGLAITTIVLADAPAGTVYNWTRDNTVTVSGIAASGSGNIAGVLAYTGTSPVTVTFTITPTYYGTCTGTPYTATVVVNPSNTVAQAASQTLCNGGATTAINFSSTATGGTVVYNWTGTNGTIGLPTSGSGNIASFTATNTGATVVTDTIKVTAAYTNGGATCNSAVMLFVITVNPTATVNTVADQTVCNAASTVPVNFGGAVSGTVYQWTNNTTSIGLAASGSGNIASFTATNATSVPVTATVTVTPVFYNQSIQGSIVPGDLTMPSRLFRDGIPSTCANKAFPGTSGGAHLYDTYTFVNTTGQAQCATISYTAKSTGDVFVAAYNNTFNPASLATNYLGDGGLSSIGGSVSTFSVTVASGATLVLVALEANSAPCPNYVLSVSGIGMSCAGTPKTFNITVNPTPTVNAIANQTVCNAAATTAASFSGAITGTVYNWTNNTPSIGLAAAGSGDIASFAATNATNAPVTATITVTPSYTNAGTTCTGTPTTFTITVNPTATINAVSNQSLCNTQSTTAVNFTSPSTGGTIVYNWTNNTPSIGLAASGSGNIASFTAVNSGTSVVVATITVTPSYTNGATCAGTPITFTITVAPPPAVTCPGNISVDAIPALCNAVVTYTTANTGSGTITYTFTGATLASGAGDGSGSAFNVGITNVTVTTTSSCGSSSCTFTVTVNDIEPPVITCPAQIVVCGSQAVNYSLPTVTDNCTLSAPLNISQTTSTAITATNSVSCNNGAGHTANGYWRVYDLGAMSLAGPYTVNKVIFGVQSASAPSGSQPVTIRVYTLAGAFTIANLTQVASENITVTNQAATLITVNLTSPPTVAANAKLVLEVFTPEGRPTSSLFYMGSNTAAQTAPNYISAPDCGVTDPIDVANVGYPNMHAVLNAEGTIGGSITPVQTAGLPSGSVFPVGTTVNTYTATDGSGNTSSCSFNVIVNPVPSVNAVSNQTVCNNNAAAAINFSGPVAGTVYNWTNNAASIGLAASGTGNIASFTGTNATNAPVAATIIVTPSYTNAGTTCAGTPMTFTITVNPTPTVNAVASQVICNGAPAAAINFSGFAPGTVYNWTNNTTSIGLAASGTGNIASFTATNATNAAVTATITVTPSYTNGGTTCTGTPTTFTITVNPTATVNAVANQDLCNGATTTAVTFTGFVPGTVYNWTNNAPSIGLASSGTGNIAAFTAVNLTNVPVIATITVTPSYTNAGTTCTGTPITFTITVNPKAHVNPVGSQILCNGTNTAAVTFTGNTANTVYNWANSAPSIGLAASGTGNIASFVATNATTAPVVATITVTPAFVGGSGSCAGDPITFTITVNPVATVTAVTNKVVCNGATVAAINFTSPTTGGTIVYNWTNNTASIGLAASGTGNIAAFTGTNAGTTPVTATITVTPSYTNAGVTCVGTPRIFTITVNPTATVNAVASQVVCNGSPTTAVTFSSPASGGTIVYNWTNNTPSIGLAASGAGNIASFNAVNTGTAPVTATITVAATFSNGSVNCVGPSITFTITVNPTATVNPVTNQAVCNGSPTAAVNFSSPTTGGTIVYNWTNNNTSVGLAASGTGDIPSFTAINNGTIAVSATIIVTPSYTNAGVTCVGTSLTFTIMVNPTATITAVPNQVVCNGSPTATINFTTPTSGGSIVFNWVNNTPSIGLAASGSGDIPSFNAVNALTAPVTATITVTPVYTNGGTSCVGTPITFTITVNPTATVTAIANQVICNGSATTAVNFSSPTTGGTIVYNWTNNNTSIGLAASGTGNIASFTGVNAGTVPATATITVTPTYSNGGTTCVGTPGTFTITVNPTATVTAVPNQTVCNGAATTAVNFSSPTTGGTIVYNWTNSTTSIGLAASGAGNITSFTGINTGTAPVTATITVTPTYSNGGANCVGTPTTFTITVNPTATITAVANQTVCNGATTTAVTFTSPTTGGTIVYNWANNTTSIGLAASGTGNIASFTGINAGTAPVTATITVTPTYSNGGATCVGTPTTFTITVNPVATVTAVANQTVCNAASTAAVTFTSPTTGGTIVYNWTNNTPSIGLAASGTGNIAAFTAINTGTAAVTATITVTPTYSNGGATCVGTPRTFTITVNAFSYAATGAATSKAVSCGPTTVDLSVVGGSLGTGGTWKWYTGSCGGTAIGTGATLTNIAVNATTTFYVRAEGTCNTTACASVTVTINPQPTISIAVAPYTSLLPGMTTTLTATIAPADPLNTIVWYRNGIVVPGASSGTLNVNVDGLGVYTSRVTTIFGCTALSNQVAIKDSTTDRLFITPNPNNGRFKIRYHTSALSLGFERYVLIYDTKGAIIYKKAFPVTAPYSSMDVDITRAPAGIYMVMITDFYGEPLISGKVVKQ